MSQERGYTLDLDQFEKDLVALVADLRVDELNNPEPSARQEAYMSTARRHGYLK
jgi:hypothetical protein